ncbi:MAG: CoA-binding protein [Brumimicrobium sp.]
METKKTLVLGASDNPSRYAYMAVKRLQSYDVPVVAVGYREGEIDGTKIQKTFPKDEEIHTVTLYLSKKNQIQYYDALINLKPKRVIFNPGTANPEFENNLIKNGIEILDACTLVMLSSGEY